MLLSVMFCGSVYAQSSIKLHYNYKQSDISKVNTVRLDSLIKVMKDESPTIDFVIVGHADSIGGPSYNASLSRIRANKVQKYFLKAGFKAERLSVEAFGLEKPVMPNETEEGRSKNRRVEIFFEDLSKLAAQKFELFAADTTSITTNSGCVFTINAADLVTKEGEEVSDTIDVYIKEYNTPVDFLVGKIPMENKQKRIFYDSYSMFDLRVFNDTTPLVLREGASYAVECPIRDTYREIKVYEFNKYNGKWSDLSNIRNVADNKSAVHIAGSSDMVSDDSNSEAGAGVIFLGAKKKTGKPSKPALFLSEVNFKTAERSSNRSVKMQKWKLLADVQQLGSPSCTDTSNGCNSVANIQQLISHKYDSVWTVTPNDTLRAKGIDVNYRMNKYFKSAVFTINVNGKFFDGSQSVNGVEWRHEIKGQSKDEFDEMMNKNWTDIRFKTSEKTKEFTMTLSYDGGREELVLKKRYFKHGAFEGLKATQAEVYSKEIYADDYCFWKENWKYMTDKQLRMSFGDWMRYSAKNHEILNKNYNYLSTQGDSLNSVWCNVNGNSKQDVKPIDKGSKVDLFGFALINFDAEIPSTDFLNIKVNFLSEYGSVLDADTVYQVMKGLNSLRTFIPTDTSTYKIMTNNDSYFYVLDKTGKRWLSSIERFTNDGEVTIKLRDVTDKTTTEKGLRKEINLYFPSKEWILAEEAVIN